MGKPAAEGFFWEKGKKNGIPLYPNLVNLKSNTMKNTMQSYGHFSEKQEKDAINCPLSCIFNFLLSFCNIDFAFFALFGGEI